MKSGERFQEMEAENICKYYESKRVVVSYMGNDGKLFDHTKRTRVEYSEPVRLLVKKLQDLSYKYLKHTTYVDNWNSVFPLMKEVCNGKYTELNFLQNLSLRLKDEVQSPHFSGRKFTFHCAIVEPREYRYHYHLVDDIKHDVMNYVCRSCCSRHHRKV